MVEWLIAVGVFVILMLLMIPAMRAIKAKPPRGGGFTMALFMILASVLDPAKVAAIEQLDRKKETGGSEEGESGAGPE
jgi:hypothetical protein